MVRAMDFTGHKMSAFFAGVSSAFALFPQGALDQSLMRQSIADRVAANFWRAGTNIRSAMKSAKDEQKEEASRAKRR